MDAKVADLIFQIIGNGKPCSKSDWKAIKKELAEIKKPSNNKRSVKFPTLEEVVDSTELDYRNPDHEQVLGVVKEVYDFIAGKITHSS